MQDLFKNWIKNLTDNQFTEDEKGNLAYQSEILEGNVNFYPEDICELSLVNKITGNIVFYLHFYLNDLKHGKELFTQLVNAGKQEESNDVNRILFCCTSGLTTNYFADKVNNAFEVLNMKCHADAFAYSELYGKAKDYDLICLAPQISNYYDKAVKLLPDKKVILIPISVFASYDSGNMVKLIEENLNNDRHQQHLTDTTYHNLKNHEGKILCIAVLRNSNRVHLLYALYDKDNTLLLSDQVIKPTIVLQDFYDVLDMFLVRYKDIECIGMSLPGIINDDTFIAQNYVEGLNEHNLKDLFTYKYHKKFIFCNDTNACVVSYHHNHPEYNSISYILQPLLYRAGVGNIVNGKLITGSHHLSGEIKLIPSHFSKNYHELVCTPQGALEIVSWFVAVITTTLDPEVIVISCQLVVDMDEVKTKVAEILGKESYVPILISESDSIAHLFSGQLILCIDELEK